MSPAKTALNTNKPLRDQIVTMLGSEAWAQFLLLVRAEILETRMSAEQQSGCIHYERTMLGMTNEDAVALDALSSGLNHNLDSLRSEIKHTAKA